MRAGLWTALGALAISAIAVPAVAQSDKTVANLKAAYIGESTASAKYAAYAKKADQEGFGAAAVLFRAASSAEKIHAANHKSEMADLGVTDPKPGKYTATPGATAANIQDAVKGETYEKDVMYPKMIKEAEAEGQDGALRSFTYAISAERQHAVLYAAALKELATVKSKATYFVCPVCGSTYKGSAPTDCPVCARSKDEFIKVK